MSTNVNFQKFSAEQLVFMLALADPNDRRTQEEIAESLGVRPETLCRWKRLPGFGEALWDLTYRNLEAEAGRVSAVLLQNALSGNFRFMRLYFETERCQAPHKGTNMVKSSKASSTGFPPAHLNIKESFATGRPIS